MPTITNAVRGQIEAEANNQRYRYGLRLGQSYYNALAQYASELAEEIQGTELDPFYLDSRVSSFLQWLDERTVD